MKSSGGGEGAGQRQRHSNAEVSINIVSVNIIAIFILTFLRCLETLADHHHPHVHHHQHCHNNHHHRHRHRHHPHPHCHYHNISREGIRCLETLPDLDTDTEASDWQGFDWVETKLLILKIVMMISKCHPSSLSHLKCWKIYERLPTGWERLKQRSINMILMNVMINHWQMPPVIIMTFVVVCNF